MTGENWQAGLFSCPNGYIAMVDEGGHRRRLPMYCGLRSCPNCNLRRQRRLIRLYRDFFGELPSSEIKLFTLTVENTFELKREHIRFILRAWDKLRRRKKYQNWGVGFRNLEVKGDRTPAGEWHIHIHAAVHCPELVNLDELRSDWSDLTGGLGRWVNVKQAYSKVGVARYLAKYLSELALDGQDAEVFDKILKGTRLFQAFGRPRFSPWSPLSLIGVTETSAHGRYPGVGVVDRDARGLRPLAESRRLPEACPLCGSRVWSVIGVVRFDRLPEVRLEDRGREHYV